MNTVGGTTKGLSPLSSPPHLFLHIPSGEILRMPPKKDKKKDEKTDDWVESVAVSQKKSGAEIRETAVNNASNATALLTKATYHSLPAPSPSSSSSDRKRANLASSTSSTAQKARKAAKKAAGRSGSRVPAAGSKKKKKKRTRETTSADSDSDDDVVTIRVTKAPKMDQEKVYNAFMKVTAWWQSRKHRMLVGTATLMLSIIRGSIYCNRP